MPTPQDSFDRTRPPAAPIGAGSESVPLASETEAPLPVPKVPQLPADVLKRFPSLLKWQHDLEEWRVKVSRTIHGA